MTNFIFIHGNKHFAIGPIRRKDLQLVCQYRPPFTSRIWQHCSIAEKVNGLVDSLKKEH